MTLGQMDLGLLWIGAGGAGTVLGRLGHIVAPRQAIWPVAGALAYGALCLAFGPPILAIVPLGAALAVLLLSRLSELRHG